MAARAARPPKTTSRRARLLRENLTAYALISPAMILLFIFGIFPVGFAFFVSLHRWRRFPGDYMGLGNYVRALGDLTYVLFFWLAVGALIYAAVLFWRLLREDNPAERRRAFSAILPGAAAGGAVLTFVGWSAILLPLILNIPQRIRGQERVPGLFVNELFASFQMPQAADAGNLFLALLIAALILIPFWRRLLGGEKWDVHLLYAAGAAVAAVVGVLLMQLTLETISAAVEAARIAGEALPVWSQIILISAGVGLLAAAYGLWTRAGRQDSSDRRTLITALAAVVLLIAGYLLAAQLPTALAAADRNVISGFGITVMFVLGTVPFQLALGLAFGYLLYQNIKAKSLFRVAYFIPYVMPFVATSIVFTLIFGHRPLSIMNQVFTSLGLPLQKWLLEPKGVVELLIPGVPDVLSGPSLALIVIMIYTTWTYIGYDAAVFLAGLGNIPADVYEAARIDGANSWQMFRRITLPLLSPTTFFLTLIAVIGTFQAFTQLWIMRTPAAQSSVDTIGVTIFETINSTDPNMGYGSAMAFVLFGVILILTFVQNRIASRSVFYG
ncbi:MAG: sugar ABC transporter permease [Anaerolineae bacterium]|nr:sugar ABC transporter permease [Anaerolineae bacterium]